MVDITKFILLIIVLLLLARFALWFIKRTKLLINLFSLKKECGAKVEILRFPYRPMLFASDKPDLRVTVKDRVYNIRIYSGGGATKAVHFASENYSVVYSRLGVAIRKSTPYVWSGRAPLFYFGAKVGQKVRYIPSLAKPNKNKESTENFDFLYTDSATESKIKEENVIIFNPAPSEVSYVTKDKTKINLAFTGDMLYSERIFTGSTFIRYADRMSRAEEDERAYNV